MADAAMMQRAVMRQLRALSKQPLSGASAGIGDDGNMREIHCNVVGAEGTPYAGVPLHFVLDLPPNYPVGSPAAAFVTEISYRGGARTKDAKGRMTICMNIFSNFLGVHRDWATSSAGGWTAACTLETVLLQVQSALCEAHFLCASESAVQATKESARNLKCTCGHTYDEPFPEIPDWEPAPQESDASVVTAVERSPAPSAPVSTSSRSGMEDEGEEDARSCDSESLDEDVDPQERCYATGVSARTKGAVIGLGVQWHKGQVLHTPAEALSLTAFKGGVRRSVDNTKGFDSFLPLSLSPEHHSRAFADAAVHQQVRNLARQCKLMDCSVVLPDTALDTGVASELYRCVTSHLLRDALTHSNRTGLQWACKAAHKTAAYLVAQCLPQNEEEEQALLASVVIEPAPVEVPKPATNKTIHIRVAVPVPEVAAPAPEPEPEAALPPPPPPRPLSPEEQAVADGCILVRKEEVVLDNNGVVLRVRAGSQALRAGVSPGMRLHIELKTAKANACRVLPPDAKQRVNGVVAAWRGNAGLVVPALPPMLAGGRGGDPAVHLGPVACHIRNFTGRRRDMPSVGDTVSFVARPDGQGSMLADEVCVLPGRGAESRFRVRGGGRRTVLCWVNVNNLFEANEVEFAQHPSIPKALAYQKNTDAPQVVRELRYGGGDRIEMPGIGKAVRIPVPPGPQRAHMLAALRDLAEAVKIVHNLPACPAAGEAHPPTPARIAAPAVRHPVPCQQDDVRRLLVSPLCGFDGATAARVKGMLSPCVRVAHVAVQQGRPLQAVVDLQEPVGPQQLRALNAFMRQVSPFLTAEPH